VIRTIPKDGYQTTKPEHLSITLAAAGVSSGNLFGQKAVS
jgi:hypothetical protein